MSYKLFCFMCRKFDLIVIGITSGDPEERWAEYTKQYKLSSSLNTVRWLEIPDVLDAHLIESGLYKAMDDAGYHRMQFGETRPHDMFMLEGRPFAEAWEVAESNANLLIRFKMRNQKSDTPSLAEALRKAQAEAEFYRRGKWASDQKAEEAEQKFDQARRAAEAATSAKRTAEWAAQRARWDLEAIKRETERYKHAEEARASRDAAERAQANREAAERAKERVERFFVQEAIAARFKKWFWGAAAAAGLLIYLASNHMIYIEKPKSAVVAAEPVTMTPEMRERWEASERWATKK